MFSRRSEQPLLLKYLTDLHILAGKYVPAISYKIHTMNKAGRGAVKIPLKGLAIGDGLCDPIHQMDYGDFLYQVGLVDENDRDALINMSSMTRHYIRTAQWQRAAEVSPEVRTHIETKALIKVGLRIICVLDV